MPRTIKWPTREEWAAKAEHATRTQCYTWQRVSADPAEWLTDEELAEARELTVAIVKATRTALTRAGKANLRPTLNAHGRDAARDWADVQQLSFDWGRIVTLARSVEAATDQVARLSALAALMAQRRDAAASAAEEEAVARAIATRNSDSGWAKELERRARIERGPMLTVHTIHEDGTGTTSAPVPYDPPFPA
jgi:hypothetical protein